MTSSGFRPFTSWAGSTGAARRPAPGGPEQEQSQQDLLEALRIFAWLWDAAPEEVAKELVPSELAPLLAQPDTSPPPPEAARDVAGMVVSQALAASDAAGLDQGLEQMATLAEQITEGHPFYSLCLAYSSILLRTRHQRFAREDDLAEAVRLGRASLVAVGTDAALRTVCLMALANALQARAMDTRDLADIDESVSLLREAVRAGAGNDYHDMPGLLSSLAGALAYRAELTEAPGDFDQAISAAERALQQAAPGTSAYSAALNNLALAARNAARGTRDAAGLNRLIDLLRPLAATPGAGCSATLFMST